MRRIRNERFTTMTNYPGNGRHEPDDPFGREDGGYEAGRPYDGQQHGQAFNGFAQGPKNQLAAGLLGIFLGQFGVHNFYLGHKERAITQLAITVVGYITVFIFIGYLLLAITWIWGVAEGIMILAGTENYRRDADGVPLV
ncbi:TM2 domain-containing protein [Corynebacterium frankenforstense]